jgi:hypothetical protein
MPLMTGVPNIINNTQAFVLRAAGSHNLDNGLLAVPPSYSHGVYQGPSGKILSRAQRNGIRLLRFELLQSGAAGAGGIGFRLDDTYLKIATLAADNVTMTDISTAVKARTATAVQVTGADQTGFVIGYPEKFGWVSVDFTTAETNAGGATVVDHTVQYSQNGTTWTVSTAGSSYTDTMSTTNAVWSAIARNLVWAAPADWMPNNGSLLGGAWKGLYLMRFTSAEREASDVAAKISGLEIGVLEQVKSIAQNGLYENEQSSFHHRLADGVVAYFGTADAGNRVYAEWEAL